MTLLELFVKNKAPGDRIPPISEYVVWLEALCYQLIKERKDAMDVVKNLPKVELPSTDIPIVGSEAISKILPLSKDQLN